MKKVIVWWNAVLAVVAFTLSGCAGYRPIVAGEGYMGVGFFRDDSHTPQQDVVVIDVQGVGLLVMPDRVIFGYADQAMLIAEDAESANFRLAVGDWEVAAGAMAEAWASSSEWTTAASLLEKEKR